ncbi:hypothetical protein AB7849_15660 [Rhodanobacter sp. 115]|uniref:hypothetical protein n=1 Tax=Rhodanobacter sp. FW021-MT20 TaxID=1162282 RepID=UPI0034E41C55
MKMLMQALFAFLVCSFAFAANAAEPGIRFHVTVYRSGSLLIDQAAGVDLGRTATLTKATPFEMPGAACAVNGSSRTSVAGTGKSGVTVTVRPVAESSDATSVRAVVRLQNSQLVQAVPIQAGVCKGETPAMLKYDSSATFQLSKKHKGVLRVGAYTVDMNLLDAAPAPKQGLRI